MPVLKRKPREEYLGDGSHLCHTLTVKRAGHRLECKSWVEHVPGYTKAWIPASVLKKFKKEQGIGLLVQAAGWYEKGSWKPQPTLQQRKDPSWLGKHFMGHLTHVTVTVKYHDRLFFLSHPAPARPLGKYFKEIVCQCHQCELLHWTAWIRQVSPGNHVWVANHSLRIERQKSPGCNSAHGF